MIEVFNSHTKAKLLPLVLLIAVTPLIVRLKIINTDKVICQHFGSPARYIDMFSLSKTVFIFLVTGMAVLFVSIYIKRPVRNRVFYAAAVLYGLMIAVSAACSEYRRVAVFGFIERYEGMLMLFCYLAICIIAYNLVKSREEAGFIIKAWVVSAVILGLIGVSQFTGADFFASNLGKKIIIPADAPSYLQDIGFRFGKFDIYGTLYNPNYVGSYMAMAFPFSVAIFIHSGRKYRIAEGLFCCLMFFNLMGCRSSAGMLGAFAACVLLLILSRVEFTCRFAGNLLLILCCGLILLAMDYASSGRITSEFFSFKTNLSEVLSESAAKSLQEIKVKGNVIEIMTAEDMLKVILAGDSISFLDSGGRMLNIASDGGIFNIKDSRFEGFKFGVDTEKMLLKMMLEEGNIVFKINTDGFKLIDSGGREISPAAAEKWGFKGKERLGSGRGYIWSRSLPLLRQTIVKGFGPDTYAFYFPQSDVASKLIFLGNPFIVVDKPHSLYLQIAINTGVISLISFLMMVGVYLVGSLKSLLKKGCGRFSDLEKALLVSITGYLSAGFFNDSVVSVAPVFWVLLGLGMALLGISASGGSAGIRQGKRVVPLRN
jgi:hypothetical protein